MSSSELICCRHTSGVVQRKPSVLCNAAPSAELPDAFRYLLKKPSGDREMVDILALVLQHDEQAVLAVPHPKAGR